MGNRITNMPGLICFWDFQELEGNDFISKGEEKYILKEMGSSIERIKDGIFGPYSAEMGIGKWFSISRRDCPKLNFFGKDAKFTVGAWIKRAYKAEAECQAIAGIWNETLAQRQYCLFIDLKIWDSCNQVCGHVSAVGGPTPGYEFCMDTAIGSSPVTLDEWHLVTFTYDGNYAKVYLDGRLDKRDRFNPYAYPDGIYDGNKGGADFTVGSVFRNGEMGNWYCGLLGGLMVFGHALNEEENLQLFSIR